MAVRAEAEEDEVESRRRPDCGGQVGGRPRRFGVEVPRFSAEPMHLGRLHRDVSKQLALRDAKIGLLVVGRDRAFVGEKEVQRPPGDPLAQRGTSQRLEQRPGGPASREGHRAAATRRDGPGGRFHEQLRGPGGHFTAITNDGDLAHEPLFASSAAAR